MKNCLRTINHSRIKVGENGRVATFLNPDREEYTVGQIDDCIIKEGVRCDSFVSNSDHVALIEFKGCDVDHACEQLLTAASHTALIPHTNHKKKSLLIVCSRFPRNNTSVQRFQAKAMREHGARLKVVCNRIELHLGKI